MADLGSLITAMVTPFDSGGEIDADTTRRLARFLVEHGSDGIVVAGTTGESPTLSDDEKLRLFELVMDEVGDRVSVIAGTGSNDTAHSVELTRKAAKLGVDAHLVVTPYYSKPPRQGIIEHFKEVAGATEKQVIVYNIPSRCVINLEPELLAELAEIENVVAVKQSNDNLVEAEQILELSDLKLYAGDDAMLLQLLRIGGSGGVCVSSHLVGDQMKAMIDCFQSGDISKAEQIDSSVSDVYKTLLITSLTITTKAALRMMGLDVGGVRLPLVEATDAEISQVEKLLENHMLLQTVA